MTEKKLVLEEDSLQAVSGVYMQLMTQFAAEMHGRADNFFVELGVPNWFIKISKLRMAALARDKADYVSSLDPRFYLAELCRNNSDLRSIFGVWDDTYFQAFKSLKAKVNAWQHFAVVPNLQNLSALVSDISYIYKRCNADSLSEVRFLKTRIADIQAGIYVKPASAPKTTPNREAEDYAKVIAARIAAQKSRPPVGDDWQGPLGDRWIKINQKTNDITENGVNIMHDLGDDADEKLKAWLRYYPKGGEARVDTDGAVCGFKHGMPKLIGYFANPPKPAENAVEGFVLDRVYVFTGNDVRDVADNKLLTSVAKEDTKALIVTLGEAFEADDIFYVTNYGDVIANGETAAEVVTRVHPGIWFSGQLPEGFN